MHAPKLRKKRVKGYRYCYTAANGGAYFGKVGEVSWGDANDKFAEHIKRWQEQPVAGEVVTAGSGIVRGSPACASRGGGLVQTFSPPPRQRLSTPVSAPSRKSPESPRLHSAAQFAPMTGPH